MRKPARQLHVGEYWAILKSDGEIAWNDEQQCLEIGDLKWSKRCVVVRVTEVPTAD